MIRKDISTLLQTPIGENGWDAVVSDLDRQGKITQKVLFDMVVAVCKAIEQLEKPQESKRGDRK